MKSIASRLPRGLPNFARYCTPAQIYMFIGVAHICLMLAANYGNANTLSLGVKRVYVSNTMYAILGQTVWILLFGWFIDWLCRTGRRTFAWGVLVLPYVVILATLVMLPGVQLY